MKDLELRAVETWAVEDRAAPKTRRFSEGVLETAGNGTRACCGGWRLEYCGVEPNRTYRFEVEVETEAIAWVRDTLVCHLIWDGFEAIDGSRTGRLEHDYLFVDSEADGRCTFTGEFCAPEGAECLTLRFTHRWSPEGKAAWHTPRIRPIASPSPGPSVRACVVTGKAEARPDRLASTDARVTYYGDLCRRAIAEAKPDLIALPEICLQWGTSGSRLDKASEVPGPETEVFSEIAKSGSTHIAVGLLERAEDGVYNTAVLIGPDGDLAGRYRKVHLAEGGEWLSEQAAGSEFPVFDTGIGRIGFNICMDSSVAESSRMMRLQGADLLVLPIMGDLRANSCFDGTWDFDPDKWRAIMRVRAMDNKLCMVVARNRSKGSCIVDQQGDVLAWNDGDQDFVHATVQTRDFYRFRGLSQVHLNWFQRRPHLYGDEAEPYNYGPFRRT